MPPVLLAAGLDWLEGLLPVLFVLFRPARSIAVASFQSRSRIFALLAAMSACTTRGTRPPAMKCPSRAWRVMPLESPSPACTAMILLRTMIAGLIFLKLIATRSKSPIPALDAYDCTQSRR